MTDEGNYQPGDEGNDQGVEADATGFGLDGSTPMEAGIEGRLTHAGGHVETDPHARDWETHVDVDQPVQQVEI